MPEVQEACTYSIFDDVRLKTDEFKWLESEKRGCDVGEEFRNEWVRLHWWGYLRARWAEHLEGCRRWRELDEKDFAKLIREFPNSTPLLHQILSLFKSGKENLCIIIWALANDLPMEEVHFILERIDINARRLFLKFNNQNCTLSAQPFGS